MMQRAIHFLQRDTTIWGPIFLLCTLTLGARASIPVDLLLLGLTGFYLCSRWKMRGCCYAWTLLGLAAVFKHGFGTIDHLFQLGVEGSLACAFFITALAFKQGTDLLESLTSQVDTRQAALENLEEEIVKMQEASQSLQISFQERVATLQKELEELQADHSSILILNEVLRKTSARHLQDSQTLAAQALDLKRHAEILRSELNASQQELSRFANSDALALQNKELVKELNAARYEKEQTHLINETLARLCARETLKARDADREAADLKAQLSARREPQPKVDPQIAEELAFAQEKMVHLSQMEPLFKQMKKQFEEKNQVLHQTRSDLFKVDTELQKLRMEKAALDLNPIPKEVEAELQGLGQQVQVLEEENQQLQELITILTKDLPDAARQKKN